MMSFLDSLALLLLLISPFPDPLANEVLLFLQIKPTEVPVAPEASDEVNGVSFDLLTFNISILSFFLS